MSRCWLWFIVHLSLIQARYIRLPSINCSELSPIGTPISQLVDLLPLSNWEFTFLTQTSIKSYFLLDNLKGTIIIKRLLDREHLCRLNLCSCTNECSVKLEINAISDTSAHILSFQLIIFDENDNYCYFSNEIFHLNISEGVQVNTRIILPIAYDPDLTPNNIQSYDFLLNNYSEFRLDNQLRPSMIISRVLDREVKEKYDLTFCAYEGIHEQKRSCCTKLMIKIIDVNDNSARFEQNQRLPSLISVSELSPISTELIQMKAIDPDEGLNGQIKYRFSKWTLLDKTINEIFDINADNGSITLLKQLDYEKRNNYELQIQAKDLGPNAMPAYATVIIQVIDENDCIPEIFIFSPPDIQLINNSIIYIYENISLNTSILYLTVSDGDTHENGRMTTKLISSNAIIHLHQIHNNTFILSTNTLFDREKQSSYSFSILTYDHGQPSHSIIHSFDLYLLDINDCYPSVDISTNYSFTLDENNHENFILHTIQTVDLDENDQITLHLEFKHKREQDLFHLNEQNQLVITKSLDYENQSSYHLSVIAEDTVGHRTSIPISIHLNDLNDNPIRFSTNFTRWKIQDNQPIGTFLGRIQAEDKDKHDQILYQIHQKDLKDVGNFIELTPNGSLFTKTIFNQQQISKFQFRILANDSLHIDMIVMEIVISNQPILKTPSPYCFMLQNHAEIRIQLEAVDNVSFSMRYPSSDLTLLSNGTLIVRSLATKYSLDIYLDDDNSLAIFSNFILLIQSDCEHPRRSIQLNQQIILICLITLIILIMIALIALCLQQKKPFDHKPDLTPSSYSSSLNETLFFSSPSPQFTAMTIISSSSSTHQQMNQTSSSLSSSRSSTYIKMSRSFEDEMM